jgi:ubiquinol-cytochrome c reductase core subunit 2
MISRSAIGRNTQLALRRQCCVQPANRRGLAASVSGTTSFSYETSDVGGLKVASRDVAGPTTKLAVVAKAGTRYQSAPGLTLGLEQFAFKVRISKVPLQSRLSDPLSLEYPKTIGPAN